MKALCLIAALWFGTSAWSQSVAINGTLGNKALLIVDGGFPKAVAVGEMHKGIKVVAIQGEQITLEMGGKRQTLRVGDAPASVGSGAGEQLSGNRVVLAAGPGGHFVTAGQINGRAVQFMVDTGATTIAMGVADANRIGLNYQNGQPVQMSTANGVTQGWRITLNTVRVGDVMVSGVDAVVTPVGMPYVLLGNSFLSRFQMNRNNDQMVLERRF
ncbi:MAG: retropepsin-like aspartic protease family protein [Burkholderiaceae bacterium]|jgi:aspartyl protease family protein